MVPQETTILANIFWDRYENSDCQCTFVFWISVASRHKLGGAIIANFWKPPLPRAMLKVHKHSNLTTLHGGGEVFRVEFWNLSRYFWPGL